MNSNLIQTNLIARTKNVVLFSSTT